MIQPNELRIWNLVKFNGSIVPIREGGILAITQNRFKCEPIPLTPQVLEKCGFNDFNEIWIEDMYGNDVVLQYDFGDKDLQVGGNWYKCQYLHQLQNLYFALTGEELNYTP